MSPEQARGQSVDKRTDVWAFGCVLFEMLSGRSPFARETISDTLVAILEAEPEWRLLPASTPPNILRLFARCLAKDMKRRIRDIADARLELEEPVVRTQPGLTTALTSRRLAWWLAAMGVVIAGAVLGWRLRPDASPRDPFAGATFKRLTDWDGAEQQVAISRDGKFIAFISDRSGTWDAWVGQIGADSFSNLTNGRAPDLRNLAAPNVSFTPDGSLVTLWVRLTDPANGVQSDGWTVPTIGGQLRPYMDRYAPNVSEADWSPDGRRLVYQTGSPGDPMFVHDLEQRTAQANLRFRTRASTITFRCGRPMAPSSISFAGFHRIKWTSGAFAPMAARPSDSPFTNRGSCFPHSWTAGRCCIWPPLMMARVRGFMRWMWNGVYRSASTQVSIRTRPLLPAQMAAGSSGPSRGRPRGCGAGRSTNAQSTSRERSASLFRRRMACRPDSDRATYCTVRRRLAPTASGSLPRDRNPRSCGTVAMAVSWLLRRLPRTAGSSRFRYGEAESRDCTS